MNSGAAFRPFDIQEEIRNKDAEVAISTVAARTDSSGRIFDVPLSPLGLKQAAGLKPKLPGMKAEVVSVFLLALLRLRSVWFMLFRRQTAFTLLGRACYPFLHLVASLVGQLAYRVATMC
jgi:hypothetical protein